MRKKNEFFQLPRHGLVQTIGVNWEARYL